MRKSVVLCHAASLCFGSGLVGFHGSHFYGRGCVSFPDSWSTVGVIVGANPKLWCSVSCPAPEVYTTSVQTWQMWQRSYRCSQCSHGGSWKSQADYVSPIESWNLTPLNSISWIVQEKRMMYFMYWWYILLATWVSAVFSTPSLQTHLTLSSIRPSLEHYFYCLCDYSGRQIQVYSMVNSYGGCLLYSFMK